MRQAFLGRDAGPGWALNFQAKLHGLGSLFPPDPGVAFSRDSCSPWTCRGSVSGLCPGEGAQEDGSQGHTPRSSVLSLGFLLSFTEAYYARRWSR